ncbi:MAG: response regulator [Spirochaetales bacterium]|nr:response regulator [Spirochaetales bacterium]
MTRVLIIDDDDKIRKIIRIQLHKYELEIFDVKEGIDGIVLLEKQEIDLIICDIKMRESNGIEILVRLKRDYPGIPVIMVTGFVDKYYFDEVKMLGGYALLTKPIKMEKLVSTMEGALGIKLPMKSK